MSGELGRIRDRRIRDSHLFRYLFSSAYPHILMSVVQRLTSDALLARAPLAEEEGEVGGADDVIVVEVGGVVRVRAPSAQQNA